MGPAARILSPICRHRSDALTEAARAEPARHPHCRPDTGAGLEWAKYGIIVNAIAPTVVETPMALVGWAGEKGEQAGRDIPVGHFAQPEEIAQAALYLASDAAAIITGETLMTDGGYSMR